MPTELYVFLNELAGDHAMSELLNEILQAYKKRVESTRLADMVARIA